MNKYTSEMIEYLKEIAPGTPIKEIGEKFNKKFNAEIKYTALWAVMKRYNITNGRVSKFKKGNIPHNKGISYNPGGKSILTRFKKGNIPKNCKPVGTEKITSDGYTEIKIALPNKWVRKHIYLYEKAHGKVPKGHVIIFADKDRSNFNLDNLICVSRSELAVINKNKLVYPNGEFTKVGVNIAKVKMAISRRNNGKE